MGQRMWFGWKIGMKMLLVAAVAMSPAMQDALVAKHLRETPRSMWCADLLHPDRDGTWLRAMWESLSTPSCSVEQYRDLDELLWRQK